MKKKKTKNDYVQRLYDRQFVIFHLYPQHHLRLYEKRKYPEQKKSEIRINGKQRITTTKRDEIIRPTTKYYKQNWRTKKQFAVPFENTIRNKLAQKKKKEKRKM